EGDAGAAQEVIRRAHAALCGQAAPIELLEVEAQVLLKRGQPEAVLLLTAGLSAAPAGDDDEAWLTMARARAQALAATGAQAAAIALLESVGVSVGRGRPVRAAADATLGRLLWRAGRIRDAALVMERAANADSGLGALNRARLLNNAAIAWYMGGELRSALSSWESARLLFQRMGSRRDELRVQVNLCVGYRQRMLWREAREAGQAALGLAEALGEREHEAMAAGNLGDVAVAAGDDAGAREWYDRASALAEAHGLDRERVELARRFAELALERGASDVLQRTRLAITLAQQFDHPLEVARCQALRAVALARLGEGEAAEELLQLALSRLYDVGSEADLAIIRLWAAEAWRTLGRLELARETAERVRSTARAWGNIQLVEHSRTLLDRIRAQDGLGSAGEQLARLMRLSEPVARQRDPRLLLGEVCQAAVEALSADLAQVVLVEDSGQLFVAAARPRSRHDVPAIAGSVIRTQGEVTSPTAAGVPLLDGTEVIGILCVQLPPEHASALSLGGLRMVAASAAIAVAGARRLEEASLRAQLAMEFTHDIRNPIHGIKLLVELEQQESRDDPELAESLENITQLADRILVMVRTFLSDRPPQRRSVSAAELGARLHAAIHASARAAGILLLLRCPPGLKMHVDPDEIERVLVNLVDNAIRYSPLGGAVEIYADCEDEMICWRVRDHGSGIPEDALKTLFRRGTRADDTHEGYGLGLAIAERIARAHGGGVSACNHPDGGAEFLLRLPAVS
ncbi:MAG: signal transduction histidine kinase/tetratricopeptide (TPR) repeat protein, partial [Myxococcota bacterium]